MLTIYQYTHDAIDHTEVALIVADHQPLIGGCDDTPEGRARSAQIIRPLMQVGGIVAANILIHNALPVIMEELTYAPYQTRNIDMPGALLCVKATAEHHAEEWELD